MERLPTPADDSWGYDDNPRRYDAYAREYPGYRETSRDLIELALPSAAAGVADATVLDLACGPVPRPARSWRFLGQTAG